MPTVTISPRRRGKSQIASSRLLAVAVVITAVAIVTFFLLREGHASKRLDEGRTPQEVQSRNAKGDYTKTKPTPTTSSHSTTEAQGAPSAATAETAKPVRTTTETKGSNQASRYRWSKEQMRLQAAYVYPTPGQARLESGKILTFHPPAAGQSVKFFADGKTYECFHDGTFVATESTPTFDDPFEEQLLHLATPGATFLPGVLLNHTEDELKAVLAKAVEIGDDDSDEIKEKKQVVAEMKSMISDYISQGGDYIDFIEQMQKYSQEERNLRTLGLVKLHNLIDDGDIEGAKTFLGTYNGILGEQGFAPLAPPPAIKKLLDETE